MLFEMFHDQGKDYISNIEPTKDDEVTLKLRITKGAVKEAYILYSTTGDTWKKVSMQRCEVDKTGYYEFFTGIIPPMEEKYYYCFLAEGVYFSGMGVSEDMPVAINCFVIMPGYKTPDWAKGMLWYSIMPDPFFNGDIFNDVTESGLKKTVPWGAPLRGLYEYYGGDIEGIKSKLDYVQEFSVDGIYVNPLWTSESNAGYGPNNYYETSVNYGNEEEFIDLIKNVHDRGLRFLMDAVFSYSQANSIFTNSNHHQPLTGAFESMDSDYYDMFEFEKWPTEYTHKWGGIENDLGSEKSRDIFWRGNDSVLHRYVREPYNADGYRFDAIDSFAGYNTDLDKIGEEIRRCVKEETPDKLLIGEDYGISSALSGNWDAFQDSFFLFSAKLWFQGGQFDQSWLLERLRMMAKLPRALALCLYNNYDLHDVERLINNYEMEKYRIKGVWLLQMTYIGSPVIYYGDEMGCKKEVGCSRNCFNWNQAEWNQELLALAKTLGKLRTEYTALKDGIFKEGVTDDEREITVFGRWDENGNVVTMLNQKDYDQEMVLDLKQYNITDGTVVTDYLTGQRYTVKEGCATVTIPAGGSILVTGHAGDYRSTLKLIQEEYRDLVQMPRENTFVFEKNEESIEAAMPVYGQGYIEVTVNTVYNLDKNCGGDIFLSDGIDGARITAHIKDCVVVVKDKENRVLYETKIQKNSRVGLKMCQDGSVKLLVNGKGEREEICSLVRTKQIYAGIASCGNAVTFEAVKIENGPTSLYEDFSKGHLQNLFSTEKVLGSYKLSDKKLIINSEDNSIFLTDERSGDFTFKAEFAGAEQGFAGIVSYCDDKNAVVLVKEEDALIFGYLKNGLIIPWDKVSGDFSNGVTLQLQKVGTTYRAVYICDDVIREFDTPIMANMSISRAGLICNGKAQFSYACFGNSIEDDHTFNTPVSINGMHDWMELADEMPHVRMVEQYNIIGKQKEWVYAVGGIRRKTTEGLSQMVITNKTYANFKMQGTLLREDGNGEIGMTILRSKVDETKGDGYILKLYFNNILALEYQGQIIKSEILDEISPYGLRVTIIRMDYRLYIFIGQDRRLFAQLTDVEIESGYVGFYMEDVCGNINNFMVTDYLQLWLEPVSPWAQNMQSDGKGMTVRVPELVMANIRGESYTNVFVSVRMMLDVCDTNKDSYAGVLFGAAQDVEPKRGGVFISLNKEGRLSISKMGKIMREVPMKTGVLSAYISVKVEDGLYQVYLPYEEKPVLEWFDEEYQGGVVSLISENSKTGFYHLNICELAKFKEEKIQEYKIYHNGKRIPCADWYIETKSGNMSYSIESGFPDNGAYLMELDVQVCNPEDNKSYPTIYFRSGVKKKLGVYCGGDCSKLVDEQNGAISDVAAEYMWIFAKRKPGEKWHVAIETYPNKASVKVNDSYIFKNVQLDNCLSGNFSNLPFVPEIVCRQGESGKAKTIISNVKISKL